MSLKFSRDAYELEDESDEECAESSDDDIEEFLRGTFKHQRKMVSKRRPVREESSSEDEFEKEMAAELNSTMKKIEADRGSMEISNASAIASDSKTEPRYYDNAYFDSDSDDEGTSEQKRSTKHPILSNDDLLYDPEMDDDDQQWVDTQRRQYYQPKSKSGRNVVKPLPNSDAVLNCPCCMTVLCMDCQRHDVYQHQYRAMFVMNCTVQMDQTLRYPNPPAKTPKRKGKKASRAAKADIDASAATAEATGTGSNGVDAAADDELYHPVMCSICNSEVGVIDTDEIYHFFNVLSSHT